jgi:RHS repeat-associated protein
MSASRGFRASLASLQRGRTKPSLPTIFLCALTLLAPLLSPSPARAQTYSYSGTGLTPDPLNSPDCPVVTNITGTVTLTNGVVVSGQLNAGPISLPVEVGVSELFLNSSGAVTEWFVQAFSGTGFRIIVTTNSPVLGVGDAFSGNFNPGGGALIGCDYSTGTPGVWGAASTAQNLGNSGGPGNSNNSNETDNSPCSTAPEIVTPTLLAGDPINVSTGNAYETDTDIACAPHTGIWLTRYYNSQDTTSSPFGHGWHSTWHRGLVVQGTTITATRPDGREDTFTQSGANVYTASPNVTSVLSPILTNGATTGWQLTLPDDSVETYLIGGQLASITTRAGLTTTLSYNGSLDVTSVRGPFGHTMTFTYNANNQVATMTAPDGGVYAYTYDANNNLTSVTYPDRTKKQYAYGNASFPNALTAIIDELGNTYTTIAYDAQGRATSSQHAGGADLTSVTYNANGSSTVTDANGNSYTLGAVSEFGLMQASSLTGAPEPSIGGQAFTYDANGFLASRTDFDGNVTAYTHDARGDLLTQTDASGTALARTTATAWLGNFHLPAQTVEPSGRTTNFTYDARGNLLRKTVTANGLARIWSYTYNAAGQVLTATDPDGNVTCTTYDAKGDVATMTDALGHVTRFTSYDGAGRLLGMTDPNGLVTTFTYDPRGRMLTRDAGGETTSFTYDAAGNLVRMTRPDGSFLTYVYDAAHRLTHVLDALDNQLAYTLDGNDNRVAAALFNPANAAVQTRTFAYNDVNRLAAEIGAQGQTTQYSYDLQGNLLGVTDPLNHATSFAYDALNRKIQATDANGGLTRFGYDVLDRLTAEADPRNLITGYAYDGLDDQTQIASPDTGNTLKTYDAAGNVLTATDARGKTTKYAYDALNRVTRALYADGTSSVYEYDQGTNGIGHLTRMTDPAGVTSYAYDQHGHLIEKTQVTGSITLVTRYAYDTAGRVAAITYPSGKTVDLSYDAAGRVDGLSLDRAWLISSVIYRPFGPAQFWYQGDGVALARNFDLDGRIVGIADGNDGMAYGYDAASRITAESETGAPNQAFAYDALDRLTGFTDGTTQEIYAYDPDGNRLKRTGPTASDAATYIYAAASNRLDSVLAQQPAPHDQDKDRPHDGMNPPSKSDVISTTAAFTYDAAGNTLSDGAHQWSYDARGRMASVTAVDIDDTADKVKNDFARTTSYGVNGLGQRVFKVLDPRYRDRPDFLFCEGSTEYVYDEEGHLLGEYDAEGRAIQETVYLGDLPVAVLDDPNRFDGRSVAYVTPDQLGAPRFVTDAQHRKVWEWDHKPFGDTEPLTADGFTYDLRFPGQIHDQESGLNYNMARDYDSKLGRYVQSDPIGLAGGVNTYGYVGQNPLWGSDRLGLLPSYIQKQIPPQEIANLQSQINKMTNNVFSPNELGQLTKDFLDEMSIFQAEDFYNAKTGQSLFNPQAITQTQLSDITDILDDIGGSLGAKAKDALQLALQNGQCKLATPAAPQ